MENRTILAVIGKDCDVAELSGIFEQAREASAHIAVLVAGASPRLPVTAYGAPPYAPVIIPEGWQEAYASGGKELEDKAEEIEALLDRHNVSGDITTVFNETAELDREIARRAKVCDLAFIGNDLRAEPATYDHILRGVLFLSPIAAVLNNLTQNQVLTPKNVLIAWNTSLPASRAVHAALPLLKKTEAVTIASFDPNMAAYRDGDNPGSDVAKWLSHHGCNVTVQQYPSGGKEIGACILDRAEETGAQMIVMGAYGHARMRQAVFGGTSRTLIEQTDVPVLLAH